MRGFNILIIVPNYYGGTESYDAYYPIGIPYVISIAEQAGYDVDVLNLNFHSGDGRKEIAEKLRAKKYAVAGTGGSIFDIVSIKNIIAAIRECDPSVTTMVGGRIILYDSEIVFPYLGADYGVIGDADVTLPALLGKIASGSDEIVENTVYRQGERVEMAPFKSNRGLIDDLPYPNIIKFGFDEICRNQSADKMNVGHYFEKKWKNYSIVSGFNCVNNCTFCSNTTTLFRKRAMESVLEEMDYALQNYDIDVFNFVTDIFSARWENIERLCAALKSFREKYKKEIYFTIPMILRGFTPEKAKLIKDSGCLCLFLGLESVDENVLKSMKKGITPEQVDNAIQICRQINLAYRGCFIFGDVAETRESYMKTLEYWKRYGAGFVSLAPILVLPGTQLMDYCQSRGIITDKLAYYKEIAEKHSYYLLQRNMSTAMTDSEHKRMLGTVMSYDVKYRLYSQCKAQKEDGGLYRIKYACSHCTTVNEREGIDLKGKLFTPVVCVHCGASNNVHRLPMAVFKVAVAAGAMLLSRFYYGLPVWRIRKLVYK